MNNKQLAQALRAISLDALPIKDRAAVLNAAEALEMGIEEVQPSEWATAWQPIETAPKDVLVVVYTPPGDFDHPEAFNVDFDHLESDGDESFWFQHNEHYELYCCMGKPEGCTGPSAKAPYTHWLPLPPPPVAAIAAANKGDGHE